MADASAPSPDSLEVASRYRLLLRGRRFRGALGGQRSPLVGGGFEFVDFRDYVPGDDVRHVDWRGLLRHGQLRVRQYEAEVAPQCDLIVDTSPSMVVTAHKRVAAAALVAAVHAWMRLVSARVRVVALGDSDAPTAAIVDDADAWPWRADARCWGTGPVQPSLPALPLRPGGVRVVLTDALWPGETRALLQRLGIGAAHFVCLQLLDPWELAPPVGGTWTLVDVETGERADHRLDAAVVAEYTARLRRLCDDVRSTVQGMGGIYACVAAGELAAMCEQTLLPLGVVEPA